MRKRQSGIALVLVVIGMLAVIGMAGLALDTGHLVLEKSRLQNAADAAALTAAKVLDQTGSTARATPAGRTAFDRNVAANGDLAGLRGTIDLVFEYSNTLRPFVPGSAPVRFVRVRAENLTFASRLVRVVGVDRLVTRASAVAGPTPLNAEGSEVCDLVPLLACGDRAAGAPHFGLTLGQFVVLKIDAGGNPGAVGPGNFQLLDAGSGANAVRDALMGKPWLACRSVGDTVITKPGNTVGPVEQGLNARFFRRETLYPPDAITTSALPAPRLDYDARTGVVSQAGVPVTHVGQIGFGHGASYEPLLARGPYDNDPNTTPPRGVPRRREVVVPIGECTGGATGTSPVRVLGFGCFFLLQPTGHSGGTSYVIAEYVTDCTTHGTPGGSGGSGGPHVIQLYRDYSSNDS